MVADDFADHEAQELFSEIGVEARGCGQGAQALDLARLTLGVGGRQIQARLDVSDALRAAKTLSQDMNQGRINVVDRDTRLRKLSGYAAHSAVRRRGHNGLVTLCHDFLP